MGNTFNGHMKMLWMRYFFEEETDDEHEATLKDLTNWLKVRGIENTSRITLVNNIKDLEQEPVNVRIMHKDGSRYYHFADSDRKFQPEELRMLIDAVQASKFLSEETTKKMIDSLLSTVSRHQRKNLNPIPVIKGRIKSSDKYVPKNLIEIHKAIRSDRQMEFTYGKYEVLPKVRFVKNKHRNQLSPLALIYTDDTYYLVAWVEADARHPEAGIRHYRVDRMRDIEIMEGEPREGVSHFTDEMRAKYADITFGMYRGKEYLVKLRFDNALIGVVLDRFGHRVSVTPDWDKQHFTIQAWISVSQQFYGWLLGLGKGVEILGPDPVRQEMKQFLTDMADIYNQK